MIKLAEDTIDKEDLKALSEWMLQEKTPQLTKGELTKEFEQKFADYIYGAGKGYGVFVNSGSSALLLMLYALLKEKKVKNYKIVIPSLCWITDISPALQFGFDVVVCPSTIKDGTYSVDKDALEEIFQKEKPATLLLVSVLGIPPKMEEIQSLCQIYGVELLEDFCESTGSYYGNGKWGGRIGSFGKMSCTSLYFGHIISTIEGGMIFTRDKNLYNILLMLRSHGWCRDLDYYSSKTLIESVGEFNSNYTFFYDAFNVRSTDLNAFLGLRQLDKLDDFSEKRFYNYLLYSKNIPGNYINIFNGCYDWMKTLHFFSSVSICVSNLGFPVITGKRNEVVKNLTKNNIECRPLISGDITQHPFIREHKVNTLYYKQNNIEEQKIIQECGMYLPNHHKLTEENINLICDIVNNS